MKTEANCAILNANGLPISTKTSIEICNFIRGKNLNKARRLLQDIVDMKSALPIRRFGTDLGHKKGIGAGTYSTSSVSCFIKLLDSVKANAENKGLNIENLVISVIKANWGEHRWRYGRKGRARMKNTHVYIKVEEAKAGLVKDIEVSKK